MKTTELLLLILLSLLWGGSFFLTEIALVAFEALFIVLVRVGLGAIILIVIVYLSGEKLPGNLKIWTQLGIMGLLNNAIPFSLIVWGQVHIESGLASILNATAPLFTIILAHWLTHDERMTANRLVGIVIGFAGVTILMEIQALQSFGIESLAQLAILGAAISYALAGIYGKRLTRFPIVVAAAGMTSTSTIMMFIIFMIFGQPVTSFEELSPWLALIALGLFCTALAYLIYFKILRSAGATNLLLVTYLIPVSAITLGIMFLDEKPGLNIFAGMALIFTGLAITNRRKRT